MRYLKAVALVVILALSIAVAPAAASHHHYCEKAFAYRTIVVKKYTITAAGRNICRFGVPTAERPKGTPRPARFLEKLKYMHALAKLAHAEIAYMQVVPGGPRVMPSHTAVVHYKPVGLADCIARTESGYSQNPGGQTAHTGVAQWDENAWIADGGLEFGPYPTAATLDEQYIVLSQGLVRFGCRQWCPFDPC